MDRGMAKQVPSAAPIPATGAVCALVEGACVGPRLQQQPRHILVAHQARPVQRRVARVIGQAHALQQPPASRRLKRAAGVVRQALQAVGSSPRKTAHPPRRCPAGPSLSPRGHWPLPCVVLQDWGQGGAPRVSWQHQPAAGRHWRQRRRHHGLGMRLHATWTAPAAAPGAICATDTRSAHLSCPIHPVHSRPPSRL